MERFLTKNRKGVGKLEKKEDLLNAFKNLDEKDQLKALLRLHDITYSDIAERLTVKKGEREGQKGVSLVTVQKAFQSKTNLESDRWKEIVKVATKLIDERQNDQNKA